MRAPRWLTSPRSGTSRRTSPGGGGAAALEGVWPAAAWDGSQATPGARACRATTRTGRRCRAGSGTGDGPRRPPDTQPGPGPGLRARRMHHVLRQGGPGRARALAAEPCRRWRSSGVLVRILLACLETRSVGPWLRAAHSGWGPLGERLLTRSDVRRERSIWGATARAGCAASAACCVGARARRTHGVPPSVSEFLGEWLGRPAGRRAADTEGEQPAIQIPYASACAGELAEPQAGTECFGCQTPRAPV